MTTPKEPHFHNTDMSNRLVKSESEYLGLFKGAADQHVAVGEASTWYLFSRDAVSNIEEMCKGAKYVVMTRDPTEMALSLYLHNVRHDHEDAASFETAWELQAARSIGKNVPRTCADPSFLQYRKACSLGAQLQRLLDRVDMSRVLILSLNELKADPKSTYVRVLDFLGTEYDGRSDFSAENRARLPKSMVLQRMLLRAARARRALGFKQGFGLLRFNETEVPSLCLSEESRLKIVSEFAEDQKILLDVCSS